MSIPLSVLAARTLWSLPGSKARAPAVTILLYHGIPRCQGGYGVCRVAFERHLQFLKQNFDLTHPAGSNAEPRDSGRPRVLLTFDDGFRNNAEVAAPLLRQYQVPALFFITTAHCKPGRVLWFAYLQALQDYYPYESLTFRGQQFSLSKGLRRRSINLLRQRLLELRPHPSALVRAVDDELPPIAHFVPPEVLVDSFLGMTPKQVAELAADPLFSIGLHTVDHPHLTLCDQAQVLGQIQECKIWLETVCGQPIRAFAYPSGLYDARILRQCKQLGLTSGYAVRPKLNREPLLELPRFGVYHAAPEVPGAKICWGRQLRALGVPVS